MFKFALVVSKHFLVQCFVMFIFLSFRFGINFFSFPGFVVVVIINFLLYHTAIKSVILKSSSSVTLTDVVLLFIMI